MKPKTVSLKRSMILIKFQLGKQPHKGETMGGCTKYRYYLRNGDGDITTDFRGVKRLVRECQQYLFANKLDNLDEIDKLLEIYKLRKLSGKLINNINQPHDYLRSESEVKTHCPKKIVTSDGFLTFTGEFYIQYNFIKSNQKFPEVGKRNPTTLFVGKLFFFMAYSYLEFNILCFNRFLICLIQFQLCLFHV